MPASCQKTTPRPSLQMLHHLRPQRIQHHIARQLQQVTIPLNHNGFIAPLEYMSDTIMGAVEALRVNPVKLAHPLCQIRLRCFDEKMEGDLELKMAA